jgi:hypothetical protein
VIFEEVVSIGREVLPIYVTDNYLYLAVDAGDGYGRVYRYDLSGGGLDEVWSGDGAKFSQVVFDPLSNRVVVVGLAKDSEGVPRSAVFMFSPSSENVDVAVHPNTDEINMFKSVVYDHVYRRFLVGERGYGADASRDRSRWPRGGGLWVVPYEHIFDYSRWVRVHEFFNNPEVTSIAMHVDNRVYVGLFRDGLVSRVARSDVTDLTSWSDAASVRLDVKSHVGSLGRYLIITYVDRENLRVSWYAGTVINSVSIGSAGGDVKSVSGAVVGRYVVIAVGKPVHSASDIYLLDRITNVWSVVVSGVDGVVDGRRFLYDGRKSLYIGSVGNPGKVYRLSFDHGRRLSLSVSPSVVRVGGTVTLTAELRDENDNPVPGATIEFYVVHSVHGSPAGHMIGTRTTDGSGRASITYTAPVSPARLMFFAVYNG